MQVVLCHRKQVILYNKLICQLIKTKSWLSCVFDCFFSLLWFTLFINVVNKQSKSISYFGHFLYLQPINNPIISSLSAIGVYAGLHPFASLAADQPFVCVLTAHPAKVSTVQCVSWYDIRALIVCMVFVVSYLVLSFPVLSYPLLECIRVC